MPDPRSSDDCCDVSFIVATTAPPNPAIDGKELLQHVSLQHYNPLEQTNRPSNLMLFPGEFLTNLSGQRDSERIYSLAFATSLGRTLTVGSTHWRGEHIWFTAPTGHELRLLEIMTDRFDGIINVRPHFVLRKRVVTHYSESWVKIAEKINRKAKKCIELPRKEAEPFVALMNETITRLAALDEREVLSASALAASFDNLLKRALDGVFSRKSLVMRALTLRAGMSHRLTNLTKLSESLRLLSAQLTYRFEATERQFLTVPYVSDGTDIVPFVLRVVRQEITCHTCGTAIAVFQSNVRTMTQLHLDYVSRLMYFLLCTGDLTRLQTVVATQAKHDNQTLAHVFQTWEHCVPAIRLAIKYRHVNVLKWLLFEVCLFPEDKEPPVQLDAHSPDRFWSINELLTKREHEHGAECETLRHCHQFVGRVRRAHNFHVLKQQLLDPQSAADPTAASRVEPLVPLITHAFDLKWIFTFVDMYNIPDAQAKPLFAKAFRHVLSHKLVLGLPSAIFFHKAFKHAKQQGFVTQAVADELEVAFPRVHVEGADWALELQHHVRQTMHNLDSTQDRLASLTEAFDELKTSIAQHELTDQERRCRKQLLSLFASLLTLVAPPFAILEQCISLCDPLPLVIAIAENNGDSKALDMEQFLSPNAPQGGGLALQQGLAEALDDVHINADEFVDLLRDAVRDNNDDDNRPRRDSEEEDGEQQRPPGNAARRRMSFREAVALYMEQRRELELAVQTSFRTRGEGDNSEREPALAEEPAEAAPTWRWYNMLPSVRRFFMAP